MKKGLKDIMKCILGLTAIILCYGLFAQDEIEKPFLKEDKPNHTAEYNKVSASTSNYDVKYHRLKIAVDPSVNYINGNVTTCFLAKSDLSSIYFDFRNNMIVDSVIYHGTNISYTFTGTLELRADFLTTIPSGTLDSLSIYYRGAPITTGSAGGGAFRVESTSCSDQDTVMWTLSQPYGAKNWWPCKELMTDKIDSIDMLVTAPLKYRIGSNGLLVKRDTIGSKITDHWKHTYPIPAYLVAFSASEYSVYEDTINLLYGGQLGVLNYVFPCDSAYTHTQTVKLDTVMNFFIEKFGNYPFEEEKYGHAQCMIGGAMEHSTMTFTGNWSYWLLIHELAHQWFGNKITCGSWHDIWLNEGFATYLDGLTREQRIQSGTFHDWLNSKRANILSDNYGSVYCNDTTSVSRIFSARLSYNKGAYLLHMLRWVIGDSDFFTGVYNYINDPSLVYGHALTNDFISHMESVADTTLTEFFNDWCYGEGWPDYSVTWSTSATCSNKVRLIIEQSHSTGGNTFFEMPVPIKFSNGSLDTTLIFHQKSLNDTLFYGMLDFTPTTVEFDPELWLCAQGSVSKVILPGKSTHWTGSIDNSWHIASNWDCGIPAIIDEVIIPPNTPDCIIYNSNIANCKTLHIKDGSSLITQPGAVLNVGN